MKGEDFPTGDASGPEGTSGAPRNNPTHKNRGRLAIKIEPGEKLLWRYHADGSRKRVIVDASVQK